jgi:hypothetical protein
MKCPGCSVGLPITTPFLYLNVCPWFATYGLNGMIWTVGCRERDVVVEIKATIKKPCTAGFDPEVTRRGTGRKDAIFQRPLGFQDASVRRPRPQGYCIRLSSSARPVTAAAGAVAPACPPWSLLPRFHALPCLRCKADSPAPGQGSNKADLRQRGQGGRLSSVGLWRCPVRAPAPLPPPGARGADGRRTGIHPAGAQSVPLAWSPHDNA